LEGGGRGKKQETAQKRKTRATMPCQTGGWRREVIPFATVNATAKPDIVRKRTLGEREARLKKKTEEGERWRNGRGDVISVCFFNERFGANLTRFHSTEGAPAMGRTGGTLGGLVSRKGRPPRVAVQRYEKWWVRTSLLGEFRG